MLQFGTVTNPLEKYNSYGELAGGGDKGGLIIFISNVIKLATVAAGLMALINLIQAGFLYINAGSDSKKTSEAWAKIYMSLIGLVIIVASYAIAAILGLLLFGSTTAILSPEITGPGE